MGQHEKAAQDKKDQRRGKAAKLEALRNKRPGKTSSWHTVQADALHALIGRVIKAGDAISFAQTRDGGAVVITLLVEKDREKFYGADDEEVNAILTEIWDAYA